MSANIFYEKNIYLLSHRGDIVFNVELHDHFNDEKKKPHFFNYPFLRILTIFWRP